MDTTTSKTRNISITSPAASPDHPSHWQVVLAAILAIFNATEPLLVTLVPPTVAAGLEIGTALEPVVIQTIQTVVVATATT